MCSAGMVRPNQADGWVPIGDRFFLFIEGKSQVSIGLNMSGLSLDKVLVVNFLCTCVKCLCQKKSMKDMHSKILIIRAQRFMRL